MEVHLYISTLYQHFLGKSIYFSGDTCYDPALINKMHQDGALRRGRADFFLNLKWHHNLILHEAGVPPIHTPVSILAALDEDVKRRLYLVHTSKKSVPNETGLQIAPEGVENTIVLDVRPHVHSEAIELLKVVDSIDMFRIFSLSQARELLQVALPHHYPEGSAIIEKGSFGNEFYIITAGVVTLSGENWSKNLVVGDYFGEMSLVTGGPRTASAKASTDVDIVAFRKEDFLSILRGNTETIDFILKLSQRRSEPSWQIISNNSVLNRMSNAQKTKLQACLQKRIVKAVLTEINFFLTML
jgi:CRP-like cAMP-binding protein